jgi:hypothetical protein
VLRNKLLLNKGVLRNKAVPRNKTEPGVQFYYDTNMRSLDPPALVPEYCCFDVE